MHDGPESDKIISNSSLNMLSKLSMRTRGVSMKRKKPYSINRNLIVIIMAVFVSLSGILAFYSYYALITYYRDIEVSNAVTYKQYLDKMEGMIVSTDDFLMDINLNNRDFNSLKTLGKDADLYRYIASYNLAAILQMKVTGTEGLSGLAVAHDQAHEYEHAYEYEHGNELDNDAALRYVFTNGFQYDAKSILVKYVRENAQEGSGYWNIVHTQEGPYLVRIVGDQTAWLAGVVDFMGETAGTYENIDSGVEFLFIENDTLLLYDGSRLQESFLAELSGSSGQVQTVQDIVPKEDSISFYMDEYFVVGSRIGNTNLFMYMLIPSGQAVRLRIFQVLFVLVLLAACAAISFIYFLLKRKLLQPIGHLVSTMDEIRNGNMDTSIQDIYNIEEFINVYGTFNAMIQEIKELRIDAYEKEIDMQKAHLQYLQLQIKPHYYLNGLKTLNALCIRKKYDEMQDLIIGISGHLRYMFKDISVLVTLDEELNYVRKYLELQRQVTSISFSYSLDVESSLLSYEIPPFTIQTFIENSFKYGVISSNHGTTDEENLRLSVKGVELQTESGCFLDLTICDNGPGYPEEVLKVLNQKNNRNHDNQHIGIMNLKTRCSLLYKIDTEFVFMNQGGAVSEIIISGFTADREIGMKDKA